MRFAVLSREVCVVYACIVALVPSGAVAEMWTGGSDQVTGLLSHKTCLWVSLMEFICSVCCAVLLCWLMQTGGQQKDGQRWQSVQAADNSISNYVIILIHSWCFLHQGVINSVWVCYTGPYMPSAPTSPFFYKMIFPYCFFMCILAITNNSQSILIKWCNTGIKFAAGDLVAKISTCHNTSEQF